MKKIISISISISIVALLVGCQSQPRTNTKTESVVKSKKESKVSKAFSDAKALHTSHSKWFDRTEKLPLTIITTAYIDPKVLKTKEYKAYLKLIKKIAKDITSLDRLSGKKISDKYSSIKFVNYNKSDQAKAKFNISYTHQHEDKEKLSDALRPDVEKPSQELLIRLNLEELKKGNLTIEGYKTVKESKKERNSYYYTLRKTNYSKLNKKDKNQAIVNSLLATLQLSIPEYVSIDRKELVEKNEIIKFVAPDSNGSYIAGAWKYSVNDDLSKLENKISSIERKIESLKYAHSYKTDDILPAKYDYHDIKLNNGHVNVVAENYRTIYSFDLLGSIKKNQKIETKKYTDDIHGLNIENAKISKDGRFVITVDYVDINEDGFHLWDMQTGKHILEFLPNRYKSHFYYMDMSQDAKYALITLEDKQRKVKILYINLDNGKIVKEINDIKYLRDAGFTNKKNIIWLRDYENILFYNIDKSQILENIFLKKNSSFRSISFSNDNSFAFITYDEGITEYVNVKTGKTILIGKTVDSKDVIASVFINEKEVMSLESDGTLRRWSFKKMKVDLKKNLPIIEKLKEEVKPIQAEIAKVKELSKYRETLSKQIILTSSLNKNDIFALTNSNYVRSLDNNKITFMLATNIANSLGYSFFDPFVSIFLKKSDDYELYESVIYIKQKDSYEIRNIFYASQFDYENSGYKNIFKHVIDAKSVAPFQYQKAIVNEGSTSRCDISQENKYLDYVFNGKAKYYDLQTNSHKKQIEFLPSDRKVVDELKYSDSKEHSIRYDSKNRKVYYDKKVISNKELYSSNHNIVISSSGEYAFFSSYDKIYFWDLNTGEITQVEMPLNTIVEIGGLALSKDDRYLVSCGYPFKDSGTDSLIVTDLLMFNLNNLK